MLALLVRGTSLDSDLSLLEVLSFTDFWLTFHPLTRARFLNVSVGSRFGSLPISLLTLNNFTDISMLRIHKLILYKVGSITWW